MTYASIYLIIADGFYTLSPNMCKKLYIKTEPFLGVRKARRSYTILLLIKPFFPAKE